ncbi:hypothetical protein [Noviherbaspirillum pedocola]|uniref:Uncharacterized protein n=1 Tax=Noviherbaspirillum pedocola TaxID=2801341 RepID=A0A934T0M0_9BURK|nr:hypothetical protein [Noviherbaspirillum pedocola]MBK4736592.1 hypothetical protein [Noviherbaspirillum pedocola]
MSGNDKRDDGRTIVPSHHPMPGVDDDVIDVGKRDDGILPPADAQKKTEIGWDNREHDVAHLPEAADVIKPAGTQKR